MRVKKKGKRLIRSVIIVVMGMNIIVCFILISQDAITVLDNRVVGVAVAEDAEEKTETTDEEKSDEEGEKKEGEGETVEDALTPEVEAKLVLDGLEEKRIQLQKEEERIQQEREKVTKLKKELEEKITELETIHKQIEVSLAKLDKKESEKERLKRVDDGKKIKQLVKVYSSMKPKMAGQIINNMDIVIAEKIFMNMKGAIAGKILSYVDSSKAAKISERLAENVTELKLEKKSN